MLTFDCSQEMAGKWMGCCSGQCMQLTVESQTVGTLCGCNKNFVTSRILLAFVWSYGFCGRNKQWWCYINFCSKIDHQLLSSFWYDNITIFIKFSRWMVNILCCICVLVLNVFLLFHFSICLCFPVWPSLFPVPLCVDTPNLELMFPHILGASIVCWRASMGYPTKWFGVWQYKIYESSYSFLFDFEE